MENTLLLGKGCRTRKNKRYDDYETDDSDTELEDIGISFPVAPSFKQKSSK